VPDTSLRTQVYSQLIAADGFTWGGGQLYEAPEDPVIELLRSEAVSEHRRAAIIAGCRDALARVLDDAVRMAGSSSQERMRRVCRVLDVAAPPELRAPAEALFRISVADETLPESLVAAAARACTGYPPEPAQIYLWQLGMRRTGSAAFSLLALLRDSEGHMRVGEGLRALWVRRIRDGWQVDTAVLARKARERIGVSDAIARPLVFAASDLLRGRNGTALLRSLRVELERRSWSQSWVEYTSDEFIESERSAQLLSVSTDLLAKWSIASIESSSGSWISGSKPETLAERAWVDYVHHVFYKFEEPTYEANPTVTRAVRLRAKSVSPRFPLSYLDE